MVNDMDKVAIIIPAFQAEKTISRCLDSVLNQTYTNLKVIVIDDGSTDNTGDIIDIYANKNDNIRIFHKKKCGGG